MSFRTLLGVYGIGTAAGFGWAKWRKRTTTLLTNNAVQLPSRSTDSAALRTGPENISSQLPVSELPAGHTDYSALNQSHVHRDGQPSVRPQPIASGQNQTANTQKVQSTVMYQVQAQTQRKSPMNLLFICKQRVTTYPNSIGLTNSAAFTANALRRRFPNTQIDVVTVTDGNDIDRVLTQYKPDLAIIEAVWVTPDKLEEIAKLHPKITIEIRLHSKIPFLAAEGNVTGWLWDYKNINSRYRNVRIASNNLDTTYDLSLVYDTLIDYLPNIYFPTSPTYRRVKQPDPTQLHVGCFGAARELKNQLLQAVAAIELARRTNRQLTFHVNTQPEGQAGKEVFKSITGLFAQHPTAKLQPHPWLTHEQFLQLIPLMDIGMAVSFTESFCIVAADFVYDKVPVIASPDVSWLPTSNHVTTDSATNMADGMYKLLQQPESTETATIALRNYNTTALKVWVNRLNKTN